MYILVYQFIHLFMYLFLSLYLWGKEKEISTNKERESAQSFSTSSLRSAVFFFCSAVPNLLCSLLLLRNTLANCIISDHNEASNQCLRSSYKARACLSVASSRARAEHYFWLASEVPVGSFFVILSCRHKKVSNKTKQIIWNRSGEGLTLAALKTIIIIL